MSAHQEPTTANRSAQVDEFMRTLNHPMKATVQTLRLAILADNPDATEGIKWNAPSFGLAGADRVTFNLRDQTKILVVFHRGAKKDANAPGFEFLDASGLLTPITPDRGTVTFDHPDQAHAQQPAFLALVREWMYA